MRQRQPTRDPGGFYARARREVAGWRDTVRKCWENACAHDGIPPDSVFVVFSEGNPHAVWHGRAVRELQRALVEYRAFVGSGGGSGYVGLRLERGRAR